MAAREHLTAPGATVGTVAYMSPEQARGQPTDARTDLFSLGTVLYQMSTAALPFEGETSAVVYEAILNRDPEPVTRLNGALPADLDRILEKALEKDRTLRYQSATDLKTDLIRLKRSLESKQRRASDAADSRGGAAAKAAEKSIAVLYFENLSGVKEDEYLRDGITEDIITDLSKVSSLAVVSRNTAFGLKGRNIDIAQISRQLKVSYVLEGSVRRAGQRLRITAQLVDAVTGGHHWAERYDRRLQDVFAVQDEITRRIVEELDVKLVFGEQARAWRRTTANVEAYELYLKGTTLNLNPTKENLYLARKYFQDAIARDPNFASAHTHLAYAHMLNVLLGFSDSPDLEIERGFKSARRAIALDESQGPAYTALGRLYMQNGDLHKALANGKRGVELGPNSAIALSVYAHMLETAGRPNECASYLRHAMRLGPYAEP